MPRSQLSEIRVLSIRQPYADEIVFGSKWCENRTWRTRYRGPLYIHASRWDGGDNKQSPGAGAVGAIIGVATLVDVVDLYDITSKELRDLCSTYGLDEPDDAQAHILGPIGFVLVNRRPLKVPIPYKGKLNVWKAEVHRSALKTGRPVTATSK